MQASCQSMKSLFVTLTFKKKVLPNLNNTKKERPQTIFISIFMRKSYEEQGSRLEAELLSSNNKLYFHTNIYTVHKSNFQPGVPLCSTPSAPIISSMLHHAINTSSTFPGELNIWRFPKFYIHLCLWMCHYISHMSLLHTVKRQQHRPARTDKYGKLMLIT